MPGARVVEKDIPLLDCTWCPDEKCEHKIIKIQKDWEEYYAKNDY